MPEVPATAPFTRPTNTPEFIARRYNHHAPQGDQAERYTKIRAACLNLATLIAANSPQSPEQTRAFNALDEVMFLANASIARNEPRA